MNRDRLKEAIKEAIVELMATDEGKTAFGPLFFDAIGQWMQSYEVELEKRHPDGAVEVVKQRVDILAHIAHWIQKSEGAIRGVQSDAAQARNRAAEVRDFIVGIGQMLERQSQGPPGAMPVLAYAIKMIFDEGKAQSALIDAG